MPRPVVKGKNDLSTIFPEIAKTWDYERNGSLTPEHVACKSNKKFYWKCERGHSWETTVANRAAGNGCVYCANQKVLVGFNDLATILPDLADEWNYEKNEGKKPQDYLYGSTKKVWWKCKKGHEWQATISSRKAGNGCRICSNRKVTKGYNDLATKYPEIANEWDYETNLSLKPDMVGPASKRIVNWKCPKGHCYDMRVDHRVRGCGCPYCSSQRPIVGETDFLTLHPDIAREWDYEKNEGKRPENFTGTSGQMVYWICPNNHSYCATIAHRVYGTGCPKCAESRLEKYTEKWLVKSSIDYKTQVRFKDLKGVGNHPLSYDFGIKLRGRYKYLIECQGVQHYEPFEYFGGEEQFEKQKLHDELKREYAIGKGITLIEIPYTCDTYEKVEKILSMKILEMESK